MSPRAPPPPWIRRRWGASPTLPAADTRSLALRRGATVWLLWELHHLPQTALPFPEVTAITTPPPVSHSGQVCSSDADRLCAKHDPRRRSSFSHHP